MRNRIFVALLLIGLLVNAVAAYVSADDPYGDGGKTCRAIASLLDEYTSDPQKYQDWYAAYGVYVQDLQRREEQAALTGEPFDYGLYQVCELIPDSGVPDFVFYQAIRQAEQYPVSYRERLDALLLDAEKGLLTVESEYQKEYLTQLQTVYKSVYATPFSKSYVYGFDDYFTYGVGPLLVLFLSLLVGILSIRTDSENGLTSILHPTKKGKHGILLQKLSALLLISVLLSVTFSLTALCSVYLKTGLGGWFCFLSAFSDYALCPYPVYVCEYLLLKLLFLTAASFLTGLVSVLFSILTEHLSVVIIANAGFFAGEYVLFSVSTLKGFGIFRYLNVFSLADGDFFGKQYVSVRLFGHSVPAVPVVLALVPLLIVLLFALLFLLYGCAQKQGRMRPNRRAQKVGCRGVSILECKKLFLQTGLLWLVLLLTAGSIVTFSLSFDAGDSYRETVYRGYMLTLEGAVTPEKEAYLLSERESFDRIFAEYAEAQNAFQAGEISISEYNQLYASYLEAQRKAEVFSLVEERYRMIQSEGGAFVYDTGWRLLLANDRPLLFLLLLLVPAFAYYTEKRNGFFPILLTTKQGRMCTFRRKLALLLLLVFSCIFFFDAAKYAFIRSAYPLPLPGASLSSLAEFSSFPKLSIAGFVAIAYFCKLLMIVLLSFAGVSTAFLLRRSLAAPLFAFAVLLVPYALNELFGGVFAYFCIASVLEPQRIADGSALYTMVAFAFAAVILFCAASIKMPVNRKTKQLFQLNNEQAHR